MPPSLLFKKGPRLAQGGVVVARQNMEIHEAKWQNSARVSVITRFTSSPILAEKAAAAGHIAQMQKQVQICPDWVHHERRLDLRGPGLRSWLFSEPA